MISFMLLIFIGLMLIGVIGDIGIIGTIFAFLGIFVAFVLFCLLIDWSRERAKKKNPVAWENRERREAEKKEKEQEKKYNGYRYHCPMCHSTRVRNLSLDEKTDPLSAGGRIGKNYHCDNCKYVW